MNEQANNVQLTPENRVLEVLKLARDIIRDHVDNGRREPKEKA